jgi:FSR family fosmidomycin resistance protein-like MFS transporter
MLNLLTKVSQPQRTLFFGSAMHVWNDMFFAILVPLLPMIKEDMGLSFTQVGLLKSVFNGASAVLQVPAGFLAERIGEFWPLIWGNVWLAAGLIGMAFAPLFVVLVVVSFLGGLGGGAQHPLASSMVSRAYDAKGRSTAVGTVNFAGDLGKMAAPIIAVAIATAWGWRTTFWVVGAAGIAFMLMAMMTRRSVDIGRPRAEAQQLADGAGDGYRVSGFATLSAIGFLDSATRGASLAFIPFVMTAKGMSNEEISWMLTLLFAGGAFGKFVCGWLSDRYGPMGLIWGTKGLTAALLVLSLAAPPLAMAPLMVVLGIGLNGTSSVLYATVAELIPARRRARLYGFYYTTNEGGSVAAPLFYGVVADLFSLSAAIATMGVATASILPASLTLRRYLTPKRL